jgi:hypothetical protein
LAFAWYAKAFGTHEKQLEIVLAGVSRKHNAPAIGRPGKLSQIVVLAVRNALGGKQTLHL